MTVVFCLACTVLNARPKVAFSNVLVVMMVGLGLFVRLQLLVIQILANILEPAMHGWREAYSNKAVLALVIIMAKVVIRPSSKPA